MHSKEYVKNMSALQYNPLYVQIKSIPHPWPVVYT